MPLAASTAAPSAAFTAVPLAGLVAADPVPFALYLRTADDVWVLYHAAGAPLDAAHVGRLEAEGTANLFVRAADRAAYLGRVEHALDEVLRARGVPVEQRAAILHGVALRVADELLAKPPERAAVQRAQKLTIAASSMLLRERHAFAAIRRVMGASDGLAAHSLTVSLLAMGLARLVLGADSGTLVHAGLAGLLHDVGRVGHEGLDDDPEHTARGAAYLQRLALPAAVVDAARWHHERHDGSGFPDGLQRDTIPPLACLVGIVDTFDKVYATQRPRVGVFDALRILAQAYRGCFDERVARGLVALFG